MRALRGAVFFSSARAARAGSDIPWGLQAPEPPAILRFARIGLPRGGAPPHPLINPGVTVYDLLRLEREKRKVTLRGSQNGGAAEFIITS